MIKVEIRLYNSCKVKSFKGTLEKKQFKYFTLFKDVISSHPQKQLTNKQK